jgi:hypothetical protein
VLAVLAAAMLWRIGCGVVEARGATRVRT